MSNTTTSSSLIPSLPDDVAVNILARVPRSHHPVVASVSKPLRSLLSSPLFFAARSLLSSQPLLYLLLRLSSSSSLLWFSLPAPSRRLVPVPPCPSTPLLGSAFAAVGPTLYVIGGSCSDVPSARAWALDCRFHAWEPLPSMRVAREFPAAAAVGGRIYVVGGCQVDSWARSKNWAEEFDPVAQAWRPVDSEGVFLKDKWMHASAVIDGKIYAMGDRSGVVYDAGSGRWDVADSALDLGWRGRGCVIGNVLYCYDYLGKIRGFDTGSGEWRELRGVENRLPRFLCGAAMAELGGRLVVVWEGKEGKGMEGSRKGNVGEMEIWCAEIAVERREDGELWGEIEWCDVVLMVPYRSSIVHCLAVTL